MTKPDQDATDHSSGVPVFVFFLAVLLVGAMAFFFGQEKYPPLTPARPSIDSSTPNPRGQELARTLCASCHLEPAPDVATRDRWAFEILPAKADLLGQGSSNNETMISATDWRAVCNHYLALAPDKLPEAPKLDLPESEMFKAVSFNHPTATRMTMGRIDPTAGVIYVGNADDQTIDVIAPAGRLLAARPMEQTPLAAVPTADGVFVALGEATPVSDEPTGKVIFLGKPGSANVGVQALAENLNRPVDLAVDRQRNIVVAEAGQTKGRLLLLRLIGGRYQPLELASGVACRATAFADLNTDQRPDVLAVHSGRQTVTAYLNEGDGRFNPTNYARRNPAWHYSDIQVVPQRSGASPLIITANGHDQRFRRQPLPRIPFHGVRILDPANGNVSFFHPLQNARRLVARDFDGDEDIDIVAIGYSGNHRDADQHGAVFLEQQADGTFAPHRLPHSADAFWSDVDAGDVDRDGDPDIVITAYHPGERNAPEARLKQWEQSPTTCLLLLNQTIP